MSGTRRGDKLWGLWAFAFLLQGYCKIILDILQYNTKKGRFCTKTAGAAVCRPRFIFIVLARLFGVAASRGDTAAALFYTGTAGKIRRAA